MTPSTVANQVLAIQATLASGGKILILKTK